MEELGFSVGTRMIIPIGMDISKQIILSCSDCGTKLAEVVVTETNEMRESRDLKHQFTKYKASQCYRCGGSSFPTEILEGSTFVGSLKDNYEIDVLDTDIEDLNLDNKVIVTTITIRKRKNA